MDLWDVDVVTLRVLQLVGHNASFTQAARTLGITQQAVSMRISRLEARLGLALVRRDRRGARLTDTGTLVVGWAEPLLADATSVADSLEILRAGGNRLKVASSLTIAEYLLPRWLTRLRGETFGQMGPTVELVAMNSTRVVAEVRAGRVQLGFIETPDIPVDIPHRQIGVDELAVVVPPTHPWARRSRPITPHMLALAPLVLREPGSGTRRALERALSELEEPLTLAAPVAELPTTSAIRATVALPDSAPTVISRRAVVDDLTLGRLALVEVTGLDLHRPLTALWPSETPPSHLMADLLRWAIEPDSPHLVA